MRCRPPRVSNCRSRSRRLARTPLGATEPYGEDDGVVRMLVTEHAIAVLLVGQITKTLTVLQLSFTG